MRRILVGFDGSDAAGRALARASELAKRYGCSLTVLTAAADRLVRGPGLVTPALDEEIGRKIAAEGAQRAHEQGVDQVEMRISLDAPDDALALEAREGYDLVVVGHRGLGALKELLLGSTAKTVVDQVPCSVLVVR